MTTNRSEALQRWPPPGADGRSGRRRVGAAAQGAGGPAGGSGRRPRGPKAMPSRAAPDAAGPTGATRALGDAGPLCHQRRSRAHHADPKLDIIRVTGLASSAGLEQSAARALLLRQAGRRRPRPAIHRRQPRAIAEGRRLCAGRRDVHARGGPPVQGRAGARRGQRASSSSRCPARPTTKIKADSGKDLIGKKFVEKGPAGAGRSLPPPTCRAGSARSRRRTALPASPTTRTGST